MIRAFPFAVAALILAPPAAAASIDEAPPHRPERVCPVLARLFGELAVAKGRPLAEALMGLKITTDELGRVEPGEWGALLAALHRHNGQPDSKPMRVIAARRIDEGEDETEVLYVALVERERWELERYVGQDDWLMPLYEPDPHYETVDTLWLVAFNGDRIMSLREARELYPVSFDGKAQDCRGVVDLEGPIPLTEMPRKD